MLQERISCVTGESSTCCLLSCSFLSSRPIHVSRYCLGIQAQMVVIRENNSQYTRIISQSVGTHYQLHNNNNSNVAVVVDDGQSIGTHYQPPASNYCAVAAEVLHSIEQATGSWRAHSSWQSLEALPPVIDLQIGTRANTEAGVVVPALLGHRNSDSWQSLAALPLVLCSLLGVIPMYRPLIPLYRQSHACGPLIWAPLPCRQRGVHCCVSLWYPQGSNKITFTQNGVYAYS